jgi:hypothetical protein
VSGVTQEYMIMTKPTLPANEQLNAWLTHHRHTQASFARLIRASQAQVSSWIRGRSRPNSADRAAIFQTTGVQLPEQRRARHAPRARGLPTTTTPVPAIQEALDHLRVLPQILTELEATARALQALPGVLADQVKTNRDTHAGLELLVARLAEGRNLQGPLPVSKSNGSATRA